MAQLIQFNPQPTAVFKFSPVLDNVTYSAFVTWNLYSQRYYLSIYSTDGILKMSVPLIASPDYNYVSVKENNVLNLNITVQTHNGSTFMDYISGEWDKLVVGMTISGAGIPLGATYTGKVNNPSPPYNLGISMSAAATSDNVSSTCTFSYSYSATNYEATQAPALVDINLTQGYFDTPIIFRASSNTFEIG